MTPTGVIINILANFDKVIARDSKIDLRDFSSLHDETAVVTMLNSELIYIQYFESEVFNQNTNSTHQVMLNIKEINLDRIQLFNPIPEE